MRPNEPEDEAFGKDIPSWGEGKVKALAECLKAATAVLTESTQPTTNP
jgi:hypothetical protein